MACLHAVARRIGGAAAFAVVCALAPCAASALEPTVSLTQYGHSVWRALDGGFAGSPTTVTQTTDGYIWLATTSSVARFDGVRFEDLSSLAHQPVSFAHVNVLAPARDGSLWMGRAGDVMHWKDGRLSSVTVRSNVVGLAEAPSGDIWFARVGRDSATGPLCKLAGTALRCFGKPDGIPMPHATALALAKDGSVWVASVTTLEHWTPPSPQMFRSSATGLDEELDGIGAIAIEPGGSVVAGYSATGSGAGLQRLVDGHWQQIDAPGLVGSSLIVSSLMVDRAGSLWVGTYNDGLYRIAGGRAEHLRTSNGLSGDTVTSLFEDREGNLWVTTSGGLDRFRDLSVVTFSSQQGLAEDQVESLATSADGSIWIGNTDSLDHLAPGGSVTSMNPRTLALGREVTAVSEDPGGRLWVGSDDNLFVRDHGRFRKIPTLDGRATGPILDMGHGQDGTTWALTLTHPRNLLRIVGDRVVEALPVDANRLLIGQDGVLWLAPSKGGLARLRAGRLETVVKTDDPFIPDQGMANGPDGGVYAAGHGGVFAWRQGQVRSMTTADGLTCGVIFSPVFDRTGALWLYAACGVMRISPEDLSAWWAHPGAQVRPLVIDPTDGASPSGAHFGTAAARSRDGSLWFVNGGVLQRVDPEHLRANVVVPQVHVQALMADHVLQRGDGPFSLASGVHDLEVDYAAASYVIPQKVQFRYRLEGSDEAWQDAGTRRAAFYTNLAPGHYRFRVIACNDQGLWNKVGATVDFEIPPTFVQTRWFIALCIAVAALVIWLTAWLRLRQTTARIRLGLEERLRERERIGRELHDTLLQSTQGLVLTIHGALKHLAPDDRARVALESAVSQADATIVEGRDRIQALRATESNVQDLERDFLRLGHVLSIQNPCAFEVTVEGLPRDLDASVSQELRPIGIEAIRNAFQHAGASRIDVALSFEPRGIRLQISDDGRGIEAAVLEGGGVAGHWGLPGMQERAKRIGAKLEIDSASNRGTTVMAYAPARLAYAQPPTWGANVRARWRRLCFATRGARHRATRGDMSPR